MLLHCKGQAKPVSFPDLCSNTTKVLSNAKISQFASVPCLAPVYCVYLLYSSDFWTQCLVRVVDVVNIDYYMLRA